MKALSIVLIALAVLLVVGAIVAIARRGGDKSNQSRQAQTKLKEQADFVKRFFELAQDIDYRFAIWTFLFDQKAGQAFVGTGLVNDDGTKRPAWEAWTASR